MTVNATGIEASLCVGRPGPIRCDVAVGRRVTDCPQQPRLTGCLTGPPRRWSPPSGDQCRGSTGTFADYSRQLKVHVRDSALYEGCPSVITSAVQVVLFQSRGALAIGLLRKADFR